MVEITSYFVAAPLLPGMGFMALFFSNSWEVFHEEPGVLVFIPLVSVAVDSLIIFATWNYYLRRKQRRQNETPLEKSEKYVTLHLS
jgi:membrane protein DedA with SNARE-associated domain